MISHQTPRSWDLEKVQTLEENTIIIAHVLAMLPAVIIWAVVVGGGACHLRPFRTGPHPILPEIQTTAQSAEPVSHRTSLNS